MSSSSPSSSSAGSIKLERRDQIAWITLNDPDRRNPLTPEFIPRMLAIFDELEADPACRVAVLTGTGKAFCAGAELSTIVNAEGIDAEVQFRLVRGFNRVIARIREVDLPVIAAINGVAVGGGAALALACDFAIASEKASLMFAFGRIGAASADMGLTWLLPRMVGIARARQLLLTGETLDAKAAQGLGLVTDVVASDALHSAAEAIARKVITATPRRAAAATKLSIDHGQGVDLATALGYEAYLQTLMFQTAEHRERLSAFLAGRGRTG